ncbi:MAG: hypothetical protein Q7T20_15630 [Saprospiraceae bacterium]|nr:hypothetical protein [Saprospiraceae bacterium]
MKPWNDWKLVILACLLLGLAPFVPEPHLLGKLRWVAGGAVGMQAMDWFDLAWHGLPWVLLLRLILLKIFAALKTNRAQ